MLFIFSFFSVIGGSIGGLIGIIYTEKSMRGSNVSYSSAIYWIIFGAILGFDVYTALYLLFINITALAANFGLQFIPLLTGLLLLASGPFLFILLALIPAMAAAAIVFQTEMLFFKETNQQPSTNNKKIINIIAITICSVYLTSGVMLTLDTIIDNNSGYIDKYENAQWRQLPQPPDEIDKLVAALPFEVYIKTKSGRLLGCQVASQFDKNCWYTAQSIPRAPDLPCGEIDNRFLSPEEIAGLILEDGLPGDAAVLQFVTVRLCDYAGRERVRSKFQYALLSNGEIWQWGVDNFHISKTPNLDELHLGADVISILAGILVWIITIFRL